MREAKESWPDPLRLDVPSPVTAKVSDKLLSIIEWVNTLDIGAWVIASNGSGNCRFEIGPRRGGEVTVEDLVRCLETEDRLLDDSWAVERAFKYGDTNERISIDVPKILGKTEPEIDWSRPQLLKTPYQDTVVKSTGYHKDGKFEAEWVSSNVDWEYSKEPEMWEKSEFSYHGEIPTEGKCANDTDGDGNCGRTNCICAKKATGLNFLEAISTCGDNLIRRPDNAIYGFDNSGCLRMKNYNSPDDRYSWSPSVFDRNDFTATDWQIIEP